MEYKEIRKNQKVKVNTAKPQNGVVVSKEIIEIGGSKVERVYIDTDRGGRLLCAPSVLSRRED
jgi:hypothetical protein